MISARVVIEHRLDGFSANTHRIWASSQTRVRTLQHVLVFPGDPAKTRVKIPIRRVLVGDTMFCSTGRTMSKLEGSKTRQNLKDAFTGESMANPRYLYFAKVAGNFRETAVGRTSHAHCHLDYLKAVGDAAT